MKTFRGPKHDKIIFDDMFYPETCYPELAWVREKIQKDKYMRHTDLYKIQPNPSRIDKLRYFIQEISHDVGYDDTEIAELDKKLAKIYASDSDYTVPLNESVKMLSDARAEAIHLLIAWMFNPERPELRNKTSKFLVEHT